MSFSTFSKEFTENMFTSVENKFITKYLPQASGDAVRAYLYGLYLCGCGGDFDAESVAKLLKLTPARLLEIFEFWEECDLVHILSRDPLFLEYLPVNASAGKPKPIRAEKYAGFNRDLMRILQKAGKDFTPPQHRAILEFLEENQMEPQAFLLVLDYRIKKDKRFEWKHLMNTAQKLCREQKFTYEQVDREFSDYNRHEEFLSELLRQFGTFKKPQETDYELLEKWFERGVTPGAVSACARSLNKGSMVALDALVTELADAGIFEADEAEEYLGKRKEMTSLVFDIAKKLGLKIENPRAYVEEYLEKWLDRGYDGESLVRLSALCFKLRYGFSEMDALLDSLYAEGIVDGTGVESYVAAREKQFKLLQAVQAETGTVKKTQAALDMVATWKSWNFGDKMILEAAKRSAGASAPLSYMNKLLSEWKRTGVFSVGEIPDRPAKQETSASYKSEAALAADRRADREHHYAVLRQSALEQAERAKARAEQDEEYLRAEVQIKRGEIELAKAEVFAPETVSALEEQLGEWRKKRSAALARLALSEEDLQPKYHCPLCSDTGFLPNGKPCDCYPGS